MNDSLKDTKYEWSDSTHDESSSSEENVSFMAFDSSDGSNCNSRCNGMQTKHEYVTKNEHENE